MKQQVLQLALLFTGMSALWLGGDAQREFTIDWVKLTLLPGPTVESGTNLTLHCEAKISYSSSQLVHTFRLLLDGKVIYSKNTSNAILERSLTPARASNSGLYVCEVRISSKEMSSETQMLTVKGLQTPKLRVQPSTVYEGDEISASCSAPQETGSMTFRFYKDDKYIILVHTIKNASATATMKVHKLGNSRLHCNYTLPMSHGTLTSNNSNIVEVSVKELAITPSIRIWPHMNVVEGDRVSISCNVSRNAQRDLEIFLTKDKLLQIMTTPFTHSFQAKVEDSGEYVCKAEMGNVQKTASAQLNVTILFSTPVLSITPAEVFERQNFILSCNSSTNAQRQPEVTYRLYKDQSLLWSGHTISLTATKTNSGNYMCEANAIGIRKTSKQLPITVKVPVSAPVIRAVGRIILGRPFQLACESKLGTLPITFTLLKDGKAVADVNVSRSLRMALFNISAVLSRMDVHSFSCQAQNQGPQRLLHSPALDAPVIETVSKPVLTLDPKGYTVMEGTNLTLHCNVQHGTSPVHFSFYRDSAAGPFFNMSSSKPQGSHTIVSVKRDHGGGYYCKASNDANVTKRSDSVHFGVNLAAWKKAAIAALCFLLMVFILIILVVFLKKARAPPRSKRGVELSVKSSRPKSGDPMRVSLTLDFEDNNAVNATPSVIGRNVWSEHVSSSESDEQSKEEEEEEKEEEEECEKLQHTEPPPPQEMDIEADTPTAEDKVQDCKQDMKPQTQKSAQLEYVQLNHSVQEPV